MLCLHLNKAFVAVSNIKFLVNLMRADLDGNVVDLELAERPQSELIKNANKGLM